MTNHAYTYAHPRPMVTTDAVVFGRREGQWHVLLIQRKNDPFAGAWALPGGYVEMDEPLETGVARELKEETGLTGVTLRQLHAFGDPGRDPRGRTITVAYLGVAEPGAPEPKGADDAADARWFPVNALPALAFDHGRIIRYAVQTLQGGSSPQDREEAQP